MTTKLKNPKTLPPSYSLINAIEEFPLWWYEIGFIRACGRTLSLPFAKPAAGIKKAWTYAAWRSSRIVESDLYDLRQKVCEPCEFNQDVGGKRYCSSKSCGCGAPRPGSTPRDNTPIVEFARWLWRSKWLPIQWAWAVVSTAFTVVFIIPFVPRDPSLRNKNARERWNCPLARHPGSHRTEQSQAEKDGKPGLLPLEDRLRMMGIEMPPIPAPPDPTAAGTFLRDGVALPPARLL